MDVGKEFRAQRSSIPPANIRAVLQNRLNIFFLHLGKPFHFDRALSLPYPLHLRDGGVALLLRRPVQERTELLAWD